MRNIRLTCLAAVLLLLSVPFASAATYEATELLATSMETPSALITVNWDNTDTGYPDDDDKTVANIGFDFTFKDTTYNQVRILTNGVLHFGTDQRFHRDYQNEALPTTQADRFIAPYWDDLVDDSLSSVTYGTMGAAPNRSFVVTWNNVKAYANNLRYDFQVVLYENGDIRFRYDNNTSNGESATIGIEVDDSDVTQYSYNRSSVRTDFDLVFKNTLLVSPDALLSFRMDEESWGSGSGVVEDSSGSGLNGTAVNGPVTNNLDPALEGDPGTCRYGEFDGNNDYINISDDPLLDLTGSFTIAAWIKIDSIPSSGLKTILSKDENYEFHVNSSGQINWWWQTVTPSNTRQFNSTGTITPGQWTHVAIRYQSGNQTIFLNGAPSGSASYTGTPRTNNDPLQIGADQNSSGRYFNGDIDEVRIFSVALGNAQIATLASETHFCQTVVEGCSASFPDAVSSHNNGALSLDTGIGINSPDNQLQFGSISPTSNSACGGAACTADSGNPAPAVDPGVFPDTSSSSWPDMAVPNNGSDTLGAGGIYQYDRIQVNSNGTLDVTSGISDYYIDELTLDRDVTLNLRGGEYWIRRLSVARNVNIKVIGSGSVRLFISESVSFGRDAWLNNSDVAGSTGDASQLLIYGYSALTFDRNTRVWGAIYSQSNINLGHSSSYTGAITGNNVTISKNTSISYDAAAMANIDLGSLCGGGSCALGSFAVTQLPYGLACPNARSVVNIQAMCVDGVTPKTDYAGTIGLSSNENTQSDFFLSNVGGSAVNEVILTGAENGEIDVYLFHKNENPDLKVTAEDTALGVSSTALTGTDFRTSGFRVDQPPNFDFVCGNSNTFTITAVGQNNPSSGSCNTLTGFTGSKSLKAWADVNIDPATPGTKSTGLPEYILLNGGAVAENKPLANNINIDFSAGVATVDVTYADVGEVLYVSFEHDDFPYDGTVPEITNSLTGSLDRFIVSPDKVTIEADAADSACISGSAACKKFVRANEPFAMTSQAMCAGSPAFIAKSYQGTVKLTSSLIAPASGTPAAPVVDEIVFDGSIPLGEEKIANQQIGEVGVFILTAAPLNYFNIPITRYDSANIGRFYPASFDVSIGSADFSLSCSSSFTYMGQPFRYLTPPDVTIKALSFTGALTENYEGDFWMLGSSLDKDSSCTVGTSGFCYTDNVAGGATLETPDSSQSYGDITNANGTVALTLHQLLTDEFNYQRRSTGLLVSPFDADVKLNIRLRDGDGVEGSGELANIGVSGDPDTTPPGTPMNTTNNEYLKYGRWVLENAFGPETNPLKIPMSAEFYDGSNFVTNTDDDCSTFDAANMRVAPNLKNSGTTSASGSGVAISGLAQLANQIELSAPGAGKDGIAELCLDVERWLKFDWNNDGLDLGQVCDTTGTPTMGDNDNPMSTATFGRYRGHDRIIYWRELSN